MRTPTRASRSNPYQSRKRDDHLDHRCWKCPVASANLFPLNGRLAQLVEHCVHTAGVTGSSPVAPTLTRPALGDQAWDICYDETAY